LKTPSTECWCGRPLHYRTESEQKRVEETIAIYGEFVNVLVGSQTDYKRFSVQRHYIGLHGINNKDLAALGFKEV